MLIDTHCLIHTPHGYLPGLPAKVLQILAPHLIVLLEAPPEIIANRRHGDASRERDPADVAQIAEHQHRNRSFAEGFGRIRVAPLNNSGPVATTATSLKSLLINS